jgi:hypothetical protein
MDDAFCQINDARFTRRTVSLARYAPKGSVVDLGTPGDSKLHPGVTSQVTPGWAESVPLVIEIDPTESEGKQVCVSAILPFKVCM